MIRSVGVRSWFGVAGALACISISGMAAGAQSAGSPSSPSFEVASIRPNRSQGLGGSLNWHEDTFTAKNLATLSLIEFAFNVQRFQVSSGPTWINTTGYDIEAKMDESVAASLEKLSSSRRQQQRRMMVESLLTDRFKLKFRRETRELATYALVVAKSGPKLSELKPDDASNNGVKRPDGRTYFGPLISVLPAYTQIRGGGSSMGSLAELLTEHLGRIVLDRTGLEGKYDYMLQWTRDEYQNGIVGFAAGEQGLKPATDADSSPLRSSQPFASSLG